MRLPSLYRGLLVLDSVVGLLLKTKTPDQLKIKDLLLKTPILFPIKSKIKTKVKIAFMRKTKSKDLVLAFLGAGSFHSRCNQYPRPRPMDSVSNWQTSRHPHEFCRPLSASGLPRKLVFWPPSSSTTQVSTTFSSSSDYRPWLSLLPLHGTELGLLRTGLASIRMCPSPKIILTVLHVRKRTQRSSRVL